MKQVKEMLQCPRCEQGWVITCRIIGNSDTFKVCEECDTVWEDGSEPSNIPPFQFLEEYMERFNMPPLWSNLERLEGK